MSPVTNAHSYQVGRKCDLPENKCQLCKNQIEVEKTPQPNTLHPTIARRSLIVMSIFLVCVFMSPPIGPRKIYG